MVNAFIIILVEICETPLTTLQKPGQLEGAVNDGFLATV